MKVKYDSYTLPPIRRFEKNACYIIQTVRTFPRIYRAEIEYFD